jgi:uracil-DNA glycosylase
VKAYADFKNELAGSACTRCALHAARARIVVDRGNPKAKALFIGEAPGANEDREGRAFVGRAGKLLDSMLAQEGFSTEEDALIANVVKCRPPENRRPKPEEAEACLPFLRKQIELVRPKWLVLLGATALSHLLPSKKGLAMSSEAGRFFEDPGYPGAKLFVLFHPAYILRDPRKRPIMEGHLKKFVETWRSG